VKFIKKREDAFNITVNSFATADERCKKIKDAMLYLNGTMHPKAPFDGNRQKYADSLLDMKTETLAQIGNVTNTKNIHTCAGIDELLKTTKDE